MLSRDCGGSGGLGRAGLGAAWPGRTSAATPARRCRNGRRVDSSVGPTMPLTDAAARRGLLCDGARTLTTTMMPRLAATHATAAVAAGVRAEMRITLWQTTVKVWSGWA